jgi:hypothetical protein
MPLARHAVGYPLHAGTVFSPGEAYASPAQPKDMPLARHAVGYPLHAGTRRRGSRPRPYCC